MGLSWNPIAGGEALAVTCAVQTERVDTAGEICLGLKLLNLGDKWINGSHFMVNRKVERLRKVIDTLTIDRNWNELAA